MRTLLGAFAAVLILAASVQPAQASSTPPQVGLVSFTTASLDGTNASLTIDWPDTSHATKYQVFMSRSYAMTGAKTYTTTSSVKKLTGLVRGANYFFQVRAVNGSRIGAKSTRVGHTTIRGQGPATGPAYRVMTYNVCSEKCATAWSRREKAAMDRITAYRPDVVALQEAVSASVHAPAGYTQATYKSAKMLWYRTDRFDLATSRVCTPVGAPIEQQDCDVEPRTSFITMASGKYAVWAELIDKATQEHAIFVSVHTTSGKDDTAARHRQAELKKLLDAMAVVNPDALPVIYAGDFNSHKNRSNDYGAAVMQGKGYYDAYDLAMVLRRQHYNSYNDFQAKPVISYTWGDHVDHVWMKPADGRVLRWENGALLAGGRMVAPIPSDHSPLVIDVRLN